jgi:serine/threonine-protein kinase TTK/MPS1
VTEAPPPPHTAVAPVRHRRSPTSDPISAAGEDDVAHVPVEVETRNLVVSKQAYARLDLIGKGGSSRIYRVMNNANEIYAIKHVSLEETTSGYVYEIALLKRLNGISRTARLVDSEVKPRPAGAILFPHSPQ